MQKMARKILSNEVFMARLGRSVHILGTMGCGKALVGKKKKKFSELAQILHDSL
jgi:ABC-type iron transport system FetAB ATPase subunit